MTLGQSTNGIPPTARGLQLLAGLLTLSAVSILALGIARAWILAGDEDMRQRHVEYLFYRDGCYPDPKVDSVPGGQRPPFSVYPPWAIPLFTIFFEPGGIEQGRILIEVLSLAALATMGFYGWKRMRPYGPAAGGLGAIAGAAITGNASALSLGQFSIICMGLVAAEMLLLEKHRPVAAGFCWALAMLKPQVGVAFTPLLLLRGNRSGFVAGSALLVGLSLLACAWTEISPSGLAERWLVKARFGFNGDAILQESLQTWTGLSQRALVAAGLAMLAVVAGVMLFRSRDAADTDLLRLAAPLAAIGMLAVYHRHYDNVMLWPTLLAAFERALRSRRAGDVAVAAALGAVLLLPVRVVAQLPFEHLASAGMFAVAACHLLRRDDPPPGTIEGAT